MAMSSTERRMLLERMESGALHGFALWMGEVDGTDGPAWDDIDRLEMSDLAPFRAALRALICALERRRAARNSGNDE
jgi:hypothetical protein